MEKSKINKISEYLNKEGFSDVAKNLRRKKFVEAFTVTQYINKKCKLKTNHWDKILSILSSD